MTWGEVSVLQLLGEVSTLNLVHMDPVNTLFWNLVSEWNIWKRSPCVLVRTANLHILRIGDAITAPLDLWTPRHLTTTTTTTTTAAIFSSSCCVRILLLLSVFTSFMRMLRLFFSVFGEFQAPPICWNMNYSVLSRLQWIHLDADILEAMPRNKRWFWYVWTRPQSTRSQTHFHPTFLLFNVSYPSKSSILVPTTVFMALMGLQKKNHKHQLLIFKHCWMRVYLAV